MWCVLDSRSEAKCFSDVFRSNRPVNYGTKRKQKRDEEITFKLERMEQMSRTIQTLNAVLHDNDLNKIDLTEDEIQEAVDMLLEVNEGAAPEPDDDDIELIEVNENNMEVDAVMEDDASFSDDESLLYRTAVDDFEVSFQLPAITFQLYS